MERYEARAQRNFSMTLKTVANSSLKLPPHGSQNRPHFSGSPVSNELFKATLAAESRRAYSVVSAGVVKCWVVANWDC